MGGHDIDRDGGDARRVWYALWLTGTFMVAEVVGGLLSGSLALLADAGHMLTDTAALALAWTAFRVAGRPADTRRTYGYYRIQVLAAFINGIALFVITGWILYEAVERLAQPIAILGAPMLVVAILGLLVNLLAFWILHGGNQANLNIRGATLHVLGDLLGSIAAIVAAIVILATGWTPIDPLLSLVVAALIARSAWVLVHKSAHILLEGAPEWLDVHELGNELHAAVPAVQDVHHVHVWSLAPDRQLLTLHAHVATHADHAKVLNKIKELLATRYGITHSTIQIDPPVCADENTTRPGRC